MLPADDFNWLWSLRADPEAWPTVVLGEGRVGAVDGGFYMGFFTGPTDAHLIPLTEDAALLLTRKLVDRYCS